MITLMIDDDNDDGKYHPETKSHPNKNLKSLKIKLLKCKQSLMTW